MITDLTADLPAVVTAEDYHYFEDLLNGLKSLGIKNVKLAEMGLNDVGKYQAVFYKIGQWGLAKIEMALESDEYGRCNTVDSMRCDAPANAPETIEYMVKTTCVYCSEHVCTECSVTTKRQGMVAGRWCGSCLENERRFSDAAAKVHERYIKFLNRKP